MTSSFDPTLVALSVLVAILASYTALELAGRTGGPRGPAPDGRNRDGAGDGAGDGTDGGAIARPAWLLAAALAMGGGIWSMHFVGMLALRTPVPVSYAALPTALSFLVAVCATAGAFFWVGRRTPSPAAVATAALPMGAGIAGMHYIGMSAMRMDMGMHLDPGRVLLSVLIAVTASAAGLFLAFRRNGARLRMGAALLMGLAVAGMHYTGMWAAHFSAPAAAAQPPAHPDALGTGSLALSVLVVTLLILFLALGAATLVQQRAARLLRITEARFRVAAEAVGDIIWTNTADGRMQGPQPDWQRFTGQAEAECQDHGWLHAIHPDDRAPTATAWHAAVRNRATFTAEHRVRRHDGAWRLCAVRAVPVLDDANRLAEWVGVHADISEQHQARSDLRAALDRAEAASLAKSTFIANMGHELRTPLTAIIGYSETLDEDVADTDAPPRPEALRADIARIHGNARHLLGLINDLLDLSRLEAGHLEATPDWLDPTPLLRSLLPAAETMARRRANRLLAAIPDHLPPLHTDAAKLRQMLHHLLSNAAKFTEAGTITLSAAPAPGALVLSVTDTGIGMTPDQQARLFERFSQADSSTTRRFGGLGLGLALCRAFADLLGATLQVRSTPGQGTTVTLTLPLPPS